MLVGFVFGKRRRPIQFLSTLVEWHVRLHLSLLFAVVARESRLGGGFLHSFVIQIPCFLE